MPACSGRQSAESPGTLDACREKSFRLPRGDAKKARETEREREEQGGPKPGELSLSQGHPTPLSIFHPMFYLEAILSYLVPHYGGS